jgi:PAS domain S-box-containing protein
MCPVEADGAQGLVDACPIGIAEFDPQGHCVSANPAFLALLGRPGEEILGRTLPEIDLPLAPQHSVVMLVQQTKQPMLDIDVLDSPRWLLSAFPILDAAGACSRVAVTLRRRDPSAPSHEEIVAHEQFFQSIFERVTIGMTTLDFRGEGIRVNPALLKMMGYTEEEFMRLGAQGISHPDDYAPDLAQFEKLCAGAIDGYQMEKRYIRGDGSIMWGRLSVSLARDDAGRPKVMIGTVEDINARKEAEAERDRLIERLQEAIRARDTFMLVASHELRTPLTTLGLQLDLLQRTIERGDANTPKVVDTMRRQSHRINRLVEDLLNVARLMTGRLQLAKERVDLAALVHDISEQMRPQAVAAGSTLTVSAAANVSFEVDRLRIEQVLANLLQNAIKFGEAKPIEVEVETREGRAWVRVRDHGIGIDKENQARIFERFERAVSELHYGGLGLGLYISRQLIQAHGGELLVESDPGAGATFTMVLPL